MPYSVEFHPKILKKRYVDSLQLFKEKLKLASKTFNTFSQKDVLFIVFGLLEYFFNFSIVVLRRKSYRRSAENQGHFLNFC